MMDIKIDGELANMAGWRQTKLEKALLASYNDMCELMNDSIIETYNHIWDFVSNDDAHEHWPTAWQDEYEESYNELSMDIWTWFLRIRYGYQYIVTGYHLTDVQEIRRGGETIEIRCNLHVELRNAGE